MRRFWDARAAEDPFYFVDNRLRYREPDLERFWAGGAESLDLMLELLGAELRPGTDVVEIGCGVGRVTRALASRGARVRALDVSERMLDAARELNPGLDGVEWVLGDGHSLAGIADESADAVQSHVVFQHIPDPQVTLGYVREIGRVLRPGGWAALHLSNAPERHRGPGFAARAQGAVRSLLHRAPRGQNHPAWLGSAVDLDELRTVAGEAAMHLERVVGAGSPNCLVLLHKGPEGPEPPDREPH
jgi:SAM-dependent methyltransferase